ncbi:MAG: multifunctional CCA tRNA nucleotidyl transferase/2'3'-cyclic phosphodiesterase/2'nucleotidase/phosphatase [Gammaproteobacteria bacterium]|nr:multifunctional CCA tRNA nucleotidyl transferase/2'3'-cyclic phosphodiesterase/2'nucleotidase/phosphatase [Gammaproteobacteria bacterium]
MQPNWQTYIVGGAVRDRLLGIPVYDYDHVVVGASPQDLLDLGYTQVGKDFPVFLHPTSKQEYALARTERKAGRGYTGFTVFAAADVTLEQDLQRRDLTINAIAESTNGELVDPYGGQQDIQQGVLRHVSPAFSEDPLRVLRLARFHAHLYHLGFSIAPETKALAKQLVDSGELQEIAKERLWHETQKAMRSSSPWIYFTTLLELGALQQLSPPLAKLLQGKKNPLGLLQAASSLFTEADDRLAILLQALNKPQIESLGESLRLPKNTLQLCVQLSKHRRQITHYPELKAEQKHTLLNNCGALRNPQRLKRLVKLCGLLHSQGQMELPELNFSVSLWQQIEKGLLAAQQISSQGYISQGLQGKALGEAIKAGQIAAIAQT